MIWKEGPAVVTVTDFTMCAESKTFRSLLGPQEPAVWYEAAEQLPKLPEDIGNEDVVDEMMAERKLTAEAQLKREKAAFEKKMKHDYRDAAYLQKVQTLHACKISTNPALTMKYNCLLLDVYPIVRGSTKS